MSRVITPSTNVRNFGPTEVLLLLLDAIYNITNGNRWLTKIIYCINNNLGVTFKDHISNTHIPCKKYAFLQALASASKGPNGMGLDLLIVASTRPS